MIFNFNATFGSADSNPSVQVLHGCVPYNVTTTQRTHDPGKQSVRHVTFHVTCLSVSVVVFNCKMKFLLFITYLLSSGTTVIGSPLLWHPCLP